MKKSLLILSIVIFSILITQCESDRKAINKKLTEMANNLNESAPVMLDDFTRFDNAAVTSDNVFQYNYTVLNTQNPDSLIKEVENSLIKNIKLEFNTNPQLLFFKENNISIEYVYNDENKQLIRRMQIDSSNYN
ncbi:MAG: hypothetical protein ITF98_05500 [Fermentimonas sp.]|nr:hypothetical protein [Fermentimonas sp.]